MGRYRTINVDLNRQYRNDLNKNFEDIEKDIFGTESDIARVEAESKERDNLMAGTDVDAIIQRIDTSADNAAVQAQHAKTQGDYAKSQGDYAKSQGEYAQSKGDYADEKAILADEAAANANSEASNLSQLKIDVTTATQNATIATDNANTATTNANNSATYAIEQGDYAKREADRVAGMDIGTLIEQTDKLSLDLSILDNKVAQHSAQVFMEKQIVTRGLNLTGLQTVVTLPNLPVKAIVCRAFVEGTPAQSNGSYSSLGNAQYAMTYIGNLVFGSAAIATTTTSSGTGFYATVENVQVGSFALNWKIDNNPFLGEGNVILHLDIYYHGGEISP